MPLFIYRWQNGDFSAVSASSKKDAIEPLDEVGNAETCELFTMKNFMVHFRLKQETDEIDDFVPVELEGFGEETVDTLCDRVYPDYFNASITEGENWPDEEEATPEAGPATLRSLNGVVVTEQPRSRPPPPPGAPRQPEWQPQRPQPCQSPVLGLLGELINSAIPALERPRMI